MSTVELSKSVSALYTDYT